MGKFNSKKMQLDIEEHQIDIKERKGYYGYFLIAVSVLILYLLSVPIARRFNEMFVPMGDAFSYTLNFFMLLDLSYADYWSTILQILSGHGNGWYWLIQLVVAFFSPIIFKEPYSVALVNFILFGVATASIFRLARYLKFGVAAAFILSVMFWLFPYHYGYSTPVSLLMMQLDTAFLAIVTIAAANTIIYAMDMEKTKNAIFAGIFIGLAVWGRGNSLPYILISLSCPSIVIFYKLWTAASEKKKKLLFNFIAFVVIVFAMTAWFYFCNWPAIKQYYTDVPATINFSKMQTKNIISNLITYPGMFFSRRICELPRPNPLETALVTLVLHGLMLLALYITFRRNNSIDTDRRNALKIIAATGGCIYYGVYLFNTVFFSASALMMPPSVYAPMLAGFIFGVFSLIASFLLTQKTKVKIKECIVVPVTVVLVVLYGGFLTRINTPLTSNLNLTTPREIERVALSLDSLLDGGSLGILWYGLYNSAILHYYRIKNDLPTFRHYTNEYHSDLWKWYYSPSNIEKIRAGIRKTFEEADFVIIPESPASYRNAPYALFVRAEDVAAYLNSSESPKFVVRMVLHDNENMRLLLLQRLKKGEISKYEPLKLPYVSPTTPNEIDYPQAMSDRINHTKLFSRIEPQMKYGKENAFDNDPSTFWEEVGPYPFLLPLNTVSIKVITRYVLQSGPAWHGGNRRMPTAWILQGSNDELLWLDLDIRTNQVNWKDIEERSYDIAVSTAFKFYRLCFTAVGERGIVRLYEAKLYEKSL